MAKAHAGAHAHNGGDLDSGAVRTGGAAHDTIRTRPDHGEGVATLHQRLKQLPGPPGLARLSWNDWKGGLGVLLFVFLTTFPVVLPFVFLQDIAPALRISNAIAIALLATSGAIFGRITGRSPWVAGIGMVIFGALLVAVTIALGG